MRATIAVFVLIAGLARGWGLLAAQVAGDRDAIAGVQTAIARRDFARAERIISDYRLAHGTTSEGLEALTVLANGALEAKQFEKADRYALDAHNQAVAALEHRKLEDDVRLQRALAAAIEVQASVFTEGGARSEAVYFLRQQLDRYRGSPIRERLADTLARLTLEGRPAPRLDTRVHVGPTVPGPDDLKGRVVLLFFWAHWCSDCKMESPIMARVLEKFGPRGLTLIAPTQRYGYISGGRSAPPDRELRHIIQVRDASYTFLRQQPVPVSEANYRQYGVTTVPMHVLIDRQGIVRLYQPGRMTEDEIDAAIRHAL